jgi:hypothetical protein
VEVTLFARLAFKNLLLCASVSLQKSEFSFSRILIEIAFELCLYANPDLFSQH